MFDRDLLRADALEVAPRLLGAILSVASPEGIVALRITEVEAYLGASDPGSHAYRGHTPRNSVMFGEPGHLYTYFTYGMHTCANIVCSPAEEASAVLLRAGEIIQGADVAAVRRSTSRNPSDLARGPARLCVALGVTLAHGGSDLSAPPFELTLPQTPIAAASGPRTGVSGPGGTLDFPWRFWIPGDPTVSPHRPSVPKKRA